jgi:hypothetical protein
MMHCLIIPNPVCAGAYALESGFTHKAIVEVSPE